MKKVLFTIFIIFSFISTYGQNVEDKEEMEKKSSIYSGPYIGQRLPGKTPEIFAPDIVSTELFEMNAAFSPNGEEFYYSIADPFQNFNAIIIMRAKNGIWSAPQVASFSGKYSDFDPVFSPNGKKLFFISRRPVDSKNQPNNDTDIWMIEWNKTSEAEPVRLPAPINSDSDEYYASASSIGTIYFTSTREGGKGAWDIYCAKPIGEKFDAIENLEDTINSKYNEHDPFIAPDESYIIFTSNRPGGYGRGDLYISFRNTDGSWSMARNLGKDINTSDYEYCPSVSPDGKYFFFSRFGGGSEKFESDLARSYHDLKSLFRGKNNGLGNIYWISFNIHEISNELGIK
jgi:Tol biopolymer transport system component